MDILLFTPFQTVCLGRGFFKDRTDPLPSIHIHIPVPQRMQEDRLQEGVWNPNELQDPLVP